MRPTTSSKNNAARSKSNAASQIHEPKTPRLVPTTYTQSFFNRGGYNSSAQLPDVGLLLDQTLWKIQRERAPKSFDALWNKACDSLIECKNAFALLLIKIQNSTISNSADINALDEKMASVWADLISTDAEGKKIINESDHRKEFQLLRENRAKLKPKIKIAADDCLEIAIAFLIEAKNAFDEGDVLRTLHALIECHLYIGMASAINKEADSKRDSGQMQGKKVRDAMAKTALHVLQTLEIDEKMKNRNYFFDLVAQSIEKHPQYSLILAAYDAQATAGKSVPQDTEASLRFAQTLRKWATGTNSKYPEIKYQYKRIRERIQKLQCANVKKKATRHPVQSYLAAQENIQATQAATEQPLRSRIHPLRPRHKKSPTTIDNDSSS